ncbi:hypothetical protein BLOT_008124 [Blomia tropicalis]|nr:hypothetical protein BLOT_008124 [Blomia tropicalis]
MLKSKRVFKEKIVQLYILIIKGDYDSLSKENENFWDEFFLLKANGSALEQELRKKLDQDPSELKPVINLLFERSLFAIRDSNQLRILNGLITLCSLSYSVLHGFKSTVTDQNERIDILIGLDQFNSTCEQFVQTILELLVDNGYCYHEGFKIIILKLMLIFVTFNSDIDTNPFLDQLMSDQLFDSLVHMINSLEQQDRCRILFLLVIFLNYKKGSINNPYVMKLSIVDNEVTLSGYSQAISNELIDFNCRFDNICTDSRSGIFSTFTNMVGTIFSSDGSGIDISTIIGKKQSFHNIKTALIAFYEAVLLNRNFISLLTTPLPETDSIVDKDSSTPGSPIVMMVEQGTNCLPTNLLVTFLEFTSIIMLDMKDETTLESTRLCFIILTCITEDTCANSIIHDNNMGFIVNLQRMPMRHRKAPSLKAKGVRPLSHAILDLMVEFIQSHMNRNIQYDLFQLCLGIIHRLISFQKRFRIRINYDWKDLWSALTTLIKFIVSNESYFNKHQEIDLFALALQVINLFNLFIMYGDNFLANTTNYDELYYEIIRTNSIFNNLNSLALRYMTRNDDDTNFGWKESATRLTHSMLNVKAIIAHFNSKIEAYSNQNQIVTLSEEQVLQVVRTNYDTLTLKLQDQIDQYESYDPSSERELCFLMRLIRTIVQEYSCQHQTITISLKEQQHLVQEIQTMSTVIAASVNNQDVLE